MQYIIDALTEIKDNLELGQRKEEYTFLLKFLDHRTQEMLRGFHYDSKNNHTLNILLSADERQMEYEAEVEAATEDPVVLMPLALDTIMQSIHNRLNADLMLFAKDFSFSYQEITFRISTSSFGVNFSSQHRVSNEQKIQQRLNEMKEQGYIIDCRGEGRNLTLRDCDKNRCLLKKYLSETLNGNVVQFHSYKDEIEYIDCSVTVNKNILPTQIDRSNVDVVSDTLTEDDIDSLKNEITHYINALHDFNSMPDKNLMLGLCRSYMNEIEKIFNYDGKIYREVTKEYKQEREKNSQILKNKKERGRLFAEQHRYSFGEFYNSVYSQLDKQVRRIGFSLRELSFERNEIIRFKLSHAILLRHQPKFQIKLDGVLDLERDRIFYVYDTPENLCKIEDFLRSILPQMKVEEILVRNREYKYIGEISVQIRPLDLKTLLHTSISNK